jgi:hypothetical protein
VSQDSTTDKSHPRTDAEVRRQILATPRRDKGGEAWYMMRDFAHQLEDERERLEQRAEEMRAAKDQAYAERNELVAALARQYPSGLRRTDIPSWGEHWHGCVYIDLPTGQISYHYHDSQAHLFAGLPPYTKEWDGHDKETVHDRLRALPAQSGDLDR